MMIFDEFVRLEPETPEQELWERALQQDSNLALDWLWLATRVDGEKRRYSLERASTIDPLAVRAPRKRRGRLAGILREPGSRRAAEPCAPQT